MGITEQSAQLWFPVLKMLFMGLTKAINSRDSKAVKQMKVGSLHALHEPKTQCLQLQHVLISLSFICRLGDDQHMLLLVHS